MTIFFVGDEVRATVDGHLVTGVIEDFAYDVAVLAAIRAGLPGDTARVRTAGGGSVAVKCTDLEPAA
jgi:hypothetical protein